MKLLDVLYCLLGLVKFFGSDHPGLLVALLGLGHPEPALFFGIVVANAMFCCRVAILERDVPERRVGACMSLVVGIVWAVGLWCNQAPLEAVWVGLLGMVLPHLVVSAGRD